MSLGSSVVPVTSWVVVSGSEVVVPSVAIVVVTGTGGSVDTIVLPSAFSILLSVTGAVVQVVLVTTLVVPVAGFPELRVLAWVDLLDVTFFVALSGVFTSVTFVLTPG